MPQKQEIEAFLEGNPEDGDYNQYWYSTNTINRIVEDVLTLGADKSIAFLSTPSLYFSLPLEFRRSCKVFDYDKKWNKDAGFVFYDFNEPSNIPPTLLNSFDMVVIDPPFITREVWEKYALTTKLLVKEGVDDAGIPRGKVIGTTVIENEELLRELLGIVPTAFMPSIPNLVYQYNLFTNYPSEIFAIKNPEIPE